MAWHIAIIVALAALTGLALMLAPRRLFAEAAGGSAPLKSSVPQGLALAMIGFSAMIFLPGEVWQRATLAFCLMTLAAIVAADLRFLIIPDIYSAALAVLGLVGPLSPGWVQALIGATVCGGLLAAVAWAFHRQTQVEGMGLGDVKLAAASGALLGPEMGLWAIAASAIVAALIGLAWRRLRRGEGPLMIPYGAALALACGALLIGGRL
jgi:leader peptidase (prepilin peptidase)/N-methyltransferase